MATATQPLDMPAREEIEELRRIHYNATVTRLRMAHDDLLVMRVRPDEGPLRFEPGQYTVLGLGYWEPRIAGAQPESLEPAQQRHLVKRAYSISCAMLDNAGRIAGTRGEEDHEFYVTLVRQADRPPALTPRLFLLSVGSRLHIGVHPHGHYTLGDVRPDDDVIFAATGTGEAPHNAMLAELLLRGHRGRIVSATCVRYRRDLAYLETHRRLERLAANYRYLALTTREPENLDPARPDYVGKLYLQEYFTSGRFIAETGLRLDAARTHVFLCGNPAMIGVPLHTHDPAQRYPKPLGMVEVLEGRGLHVDRPHEPGNIHFEKYW